MDHSVHCLLDVPDCIASPFEVLLPDTSSDEFIRGWRLDDATKELAVAAASAAGSCQTTCEGTQTKGMYISLQAQIVELGSGDVPPIVKALGEVKVTSPEDSTCPEGSAYPPAPDEAGGGESGAGDGVIQLDDGLTLQPADNGDGTASFTLTYEGDAWVALAVSPNGQMVGSQAVIGLPEENTVQIYDMTLRDVSGIVPSDTQILVESSATQGSRVLQQSSISQENGITTLSFTVPLETDGFFVSADGDTGFLYAHGSSNTFAVHAKRGAFQASLAGGAELAADVSPLFRAHGFLMAIAWGILIPIGIGASLVRTILPGPPGIFFQIHRACNGLAVVMTIVGFGLAVAAITQQNKPHFTGSPHLPVGLVIFIFAVLQALNGILRPHLPHKPDPDAAETDGGDEEENGGKQKPATAAGEKSAARKIWEPAHRLLGLAILGMAWYNCDSGINLFGQIFGEDTSGYRTAFWVLASVLFGGSVLAWLAIRFTGGSESERSSGDGGMQEDSNQLSM